MRADQWQRATEAGQQLTQESVDAYMAFANSMFLVLAGQYAASTETSLEATNFEPEGPGWNEEPGPLLPVNPSV
jgi:hypothetical protein